MIKEKSLIKDVKEEDRDLSDIRWQDNEKFGVTIPRHAVQQMDEERGDVSRSRIVYRALEAFFKAKKGEVK